MGSPLADGTSNNNSLEETAMNTGLKNKLLILAAAAGLAGFGVACSSDAPAAEEGAAEESSGGEGSCSGAEAAPAEGGEGSCG